MNLTWLQKHERLLAVVIILAVIGFLGNKYLNLRASESDAQIKAAQTQVKDLQTQIQATTAAAAKQVQVVVRTVQAAKTPAQVVQALPQLTNAPLNARVSIDNPNQVSVDSQAFINLVGQCKEDSLNLGACTTNLKSETEIAAQQDVEIKALKARPKFWQRVKCRIKEFGIDLAIVEAAKIILTKHP